MRCGRLGPWQLTIAMLHSSLHTLRHYLVHQSSSSDQTDFQIASAHMLRGLWRQKRVLRGTLTSSMVLIWLCGSSRGVCLYVHASWCTADQSLYQLTKAVLHCLLFRFMALQIHVDRNHTERLGEWQLTIAMLHSSLHTLRHYLAQPATMRQQMSHQHCNVRLAEGSCVSRRTCASFLVTLNKVAMKSI